ncbi:MAG TPA: sigma 54-interacting transcriptional regulator [Gemmatimonadales bacterium]|nr:sigma 54-interacting transcriptional regulator [Gemmatimonadales bacterium]
MTAPAEERRRGAERERAADAGPIIGRSPPIVRAVALAGRFARTEFPILLVGATGTGKELFAQRIHDWSGCPGPFVDVNCGALPKEMVESLLFGHRKWAFTGAGDGAEGLIAAADGGTLFLDELLSLPPEAQVKLLRVLETGEVRRLGETAKRRVRFRVVAAVQEDLDDRLASGDFRIDLYQRVAGVVLWLPALEERRDDCWLLALHFARERGLELSPEVRAVVERHGWPGNVRELKVAVERAGFLSEGRSVGTRAMADAIALGAPRRRMPRAVTDHRRDLEALLARHGGDARAAAGELGVSRSALYRQLSEWGIDPQVRGRYR